MRGYPNSGVMIQESSFGDLEQRPQIHLMDRINGRVLPYPVGS